MGQNKIVLYHRVMRRENFEKAATDIFNLLKSAQTKSPNVARILYVDIDGHKNDQGGYDNDMFELQKDFGLGFLAKYFTEVHFPLGDFINSKPQCNDIPDKLEIFSANNERDTSLNDLYIENHSNTEFVSEPDVFDYLSKVHQFLTEYHNYDFDSMIRENNQITENGHLRLWKNHISELINELFNSFVYGNLLTVAAMTRTLIECFVYFSRLNASGNEDLVHHWYICSMCHKKEIDVTRCKELIKEYCKTNQLCFSEMWKTYGIQANGDRPNKNRWLKQIIPGNVNEFKNICSYLGDQHIYEDYQSACSFVHGQDITSKILPFTFYVSICYRFNMMMNYIFRTIHLFPLNEALENQLMSLEDELIELLEKYYQ